MGATKSSAACTLYQYWAYSRAVHWYYQDLTSLCFFHVPRTTCGTFKTCFAKALKGGQQARRGESLVPVRDSVSAGPSLGAGPRFTKHLWETVRLSAMQHALARVLAPPGPSPGSGPGPAPAPNKTGNSGHASSV